MEWIDKPGRMDGCLDGEGWGGGGRWGWWWGWVPAPDRLDVHLGQIIGDWTNQLWGDIMGCWLLHAAVSWWASWGLMYYSQVRGRVVVGRVRDPDFGSILGAPVWMGIPSMGFRSVLPIHSTSPTWAIPLHDPPPINGKFVSSGDDRHGDPGQWEKEWSTEIDLTNTIRGSRWFPDANDLYD